MEYPEYVAYSKPVDAVIIDDYFNSDSPYDAMIGEIRLGISKDDLVHYNKSYADRMIVQKSCLRLGHNITDILVPPNTGICIEYSQRDISGIIGSPTLILDNSGSVNLKIFEASNLRLCLESPDLVILNNKIVNEPSSGKTYAKGDNFENFRGKYDSFLNSGIRPPQIIDSEFGIHAEFNLKADYEDIDICQKFKLVYIQKSSGKMMIFHKDVDKSKPADLPELNRKILENKPIEYLVTEQKEAIRMEDYERARDIRDIINRRQGTSSQDTDLHNRQQHF